MQSLLNAITQFFKDLFHFGSSSETTTTATQKLPAKNIRFDAYENPFLSGQSSSWTNEQLVLYSFEALQAWADEHEFKPRPEHTAREFCVELGVRLPEIGPELKRLAFLYSHAAYGVSNSADWDLEPVKILWRFLGAQPHQISNDAA